MDVPGNTYLGPHRLREMIGWPTPVGRSDKALDPDLAKALWTESERLSGVTLPAVAAAGYSATTVLDARPACSARRRGPSGSWSRPSATSSISATVASSTLPKTV